MNVITLYDANNLLIRQIANVEEENLESYIKILQKIPLVRKIIVTTYDEDLNQTKKRKYEITKIRA